MDLEYQELDLRYQRLRVQSPERQRRLLASIAERGQLVPIVVVAAADVPGREVVIDGYKRVRALRQLRQDTVRAVRWELTEFEALLLGRSLRAGGGETALEEAWLLDELARRFDLGQEELARRFDRSVSWVSRRLALVRELPEAVQERIRRGEIVAHAGTKYLVPLARANRSHCERLAASIARHDLSSREVGDLYASWREASGPARENIVQEPILFLRARQALAEETGAEPGDRESLLRDVHLLSAVARRVGRRWREGAAAVLAPPDRDTVLSGVRLAKAELERLIDSIQQQEAQEHARPPGQDGHPGAREEGAPRPEDRQNPASLEGGGQESDPIAVLPAAADR